MIKILKVIKYYYKILYSSKLKIKYYIKIFDIFMGNLTSSNNNILVEEINDKNIEIEKYQKDYKDLNLDYIQQSNDYDKAISELKSVFDENDLLRESKKNLEEENKKIKNKLLSESIRNLEEENEYMKNELKELQKEYDMIFEENAIMKNEINWKKNDLNIDYENDEYDLNDILNDQE